MEDVSLGTINLLKKKFNLVLGYSDHSIGKEIITLPMHCNLTENNIDKIIKFTNKFLK